jgi:N-acetylglucosaminyldiphosphoundecaprenol N-acetyl-beta-D-mannosaminyltransferase
MPVDDLTLTETVARIDDLIAEGGVHQHVVLNVAKVLAARRVPLIRTAIESSDVVNVDGQPIVWASRLLGRPIRERVAGVDLMVALIAHAPAAGHRLYFLGARGEVVDAVVRRATAEHPGLVVAGWRDGYWDPAGEEAVADTIAAVKPDIVFVAISSPAKERFAARWKDRLGAGMVMGVGGSFDVYAGRVLRAPAWMQRAGLEWLFRMLQEPRRMWRRYAGDAPRFVVLVAREWLSRRRGRR